MTTAQRTRRATTAQSAGLIAARLPFHTAGALAGGPWTSSTGRLDLAFWPSLNRADYVVTSYSTPIAWHIPGEGWVKPDVRYSATTTRHQAQCP